MRRGEAAFHFERSNQVRVISDEQQSDSLTFAFGDGIGGQGRGDRDHLDCRGIRDVDAVYDLLNTDGKITLGGQAFM